MFGVKGHLGLFLFSAIAWSIWKTRNKMAIERIFPNNPIDILYNAISFMQKWLRLLKQSDQVKLAEPMLKIGSWIKDYAPLASSFTDIVEL